MRPLAVLRALCSVCSARLRVRSELKSLGHEYHLGAENVFGRNWVCVVVVTERFQIRAPTQLSCSHYRICSTYNFYLENATPNGKHVVRFVLSILNTLSAI